MDRVSAVSSRFSSASFCPFYITTTTLVPRPLEKLIKLKARVTDSIELREKVTGAVASGEQRISGRTIYLRHDSLVLGVQQNGWSGLLSWAVLHLGS
jgi:hypothetical protein